MVDGPSTPVTSPAPSTTSTAPARVTSPDALAASAPQANATAPPRANGAADSADATHPYFDQISRVFYNYRLAEFNRRYHLEFLDRTKRKIRNLQIAILVVSAIATLSLGIPAALADESIVTWVHRINPIAAGLSLIAFLASLVMPQFGWDQDVEDFTLRVHAWHFAKNQIESAIRFLIHDARSDRDAELEVRFADETYTSANSYPPVRSQEEGLSWKIRKEVEEAIPPDYPWVAL